MLSIPHRAQDDKFTNSIEGYRGSIYKLGRLLAHDWFSVTFDNTTKERYLFLFKARILICKVRRISEDRSVFQLKDIIRVSLQTVFRISSVLINFLPNFVTKIHPNLKKQLFGKYPGSVLLLQLCGYTYCLHNYRRLLCFYYLLLILQLPQVEIRDHPEEGCTFELVEKNTANSLVLTAHRDHIKDFWLKEIREFARDTST